MENAQEPVKNRRKLKNIFLNPKNQVMAALPQFLLGFAIVSILFGMVINELSQLIGSFADLAPPSEETQFIVEQTRIMLWGIYATLMAGFFFSAIFMGALITHRHIGPIVPIHRKIKKMLEGDYSEKVQLRKGDQFQDLAEDLNKLSEKLQNSIANRS